MASIFKRQLFLRNVVLIVIANLVFSLGLVPVSSKVFASAENLRPKSARQNDLVKSALIGDMDRTQRDGGNLSERLVVHFSEIRKTDVAIAGGKGANLGELQHVAGISVPDGMAVTTKAYKAHINEGLIEHQGKKITLKEYIDTRLKDLNYEDTIALNQASQDIKDNMEKSEMPQAVTKEITEWYQRLCDETGIKDVAVAVRSSATAEDMEGAAFAGQQDTYLNVRGIAAVLDAVKRDWASLFTARSIFYRHNQGIPHDQAFLSAVIQLMIESNKAGTSFGVLLDTGMPGVDIDSGLGLGEGIVSGTVTGDHYTVIFDTKTNKPKLLSQTLGSKLFKFIYKKEADVKAKEGTDLVETTPAEQKKYTLTKKQALMIAKAQMAINNHYGMYMDVEWAIDSNGKLWILQARPETIWNEQEKEYPNTVVTIVKEVPEDIAKDAVVLFSGIKGARKAGSGKVIIVKGDELATPAETAMALARELDRVKKGDVMVTKMTKPDMVPAMKRASAIITDEGGPTCHAAIVARELRIPCLVGTSKATKVLHEGDEITVDGNRGKVFAGALKIVERKELEPIDKLPITKKTKLGIINSEPDLAMEIWQYSKYPSYYGYNLFRKEFVDTTEILVHPLAGLAYDKYNNPEFKDEAERKWIKENVIDTNGEKIAGTIQGYASYKDFYIEKLSIAIAKVASAQTQGQRIKYRTTDFKTNEYSLQTGAIAYEPQENNPMMGYRGIYRMMHPNYIEAFRLELKAIKKARQLQSNVDIMFPVVRTVEEMEAAAALMAEEGLFKGKDKPYIGMMVEVPADIFQADEFYAKLAELAKRYGTKAFMSIGSNDLTQFTLGLGRDNDKMDKFFSETDPAVKKAVEIAIKTAKKYGIMTGLCGQRPSNDSEYAAFLSSVGIDSIGVAPDAFGNVVRVVAQAEALQEGKPFDPEIAGWTVPATAGNPKVITSSEVKAADIIAALNIHPTVLLANYNAGNKSVKDLVVNAVSEALMAKVKATAKDASIIYTTDDQDRTGYEKLQDGKKHEEAIQEMDENPQLGFLGLARVVDSDFKELFRWQLEGVKKARQESGRNIGIKLSTVTNLGNVQDALAIMKDEGLVPGQDGLMVGMEIAKPSNVLLLNEFIDLGLNFISENNDRLVSYIMALDPGSEYVNYSDQAKEKALANPKKVWTTIAEQRGIPLVQAETASKGTGEMSRQAAKASVVENDLAAYNKTAMNFTNVVAAVSKIKNARGAVVIGANTIFENAGSVTALQRAKDAAGVVKFAVWAQNEADVETLKTLGVDKYATIYLHLDSALKSLAQDKIPQSRIALISSDLDLGNIKEEFPDVNDFFAEFKVKNVHVATARTGEVKKSINAMPLVMAKALAMIFNTDDKVKLQLLNLANAYLHEGLIEPVDVTDIMQLATQLSDIPLVSVRDEIAQLQVMFEDTLNKI